MEEKKSYFTPGFKPGKSVRVWSAVALAGMVLAGCAGIFEPGPSPTTPVIPVIPPDETGLIIEVQGMAPSADSLVGDPQVTAGSVVVRAYDADTHAYLGTTASLVRGTAAYRGPITLSSFGNLRFRAFVKDSSGNFLYAGEATQTVTDQSTSLPSPIEVSAKAALAAVNLDAAVSQGAYGSAGQYVILAKTGITTGGGASAITGDIAVSPAAAASMTGFGLAMDGTLDFSTSSLITGSVFASDYTAGGGGTPAKLTEAVLNMGTAYDDAAGRVLPDATELGAGDISGMTLIPGLYKWGTSLLINSDVTLHGGPADVWILQIAGDLTLANGVSVTLAGGALAKNIFWQVAGGTGVAFGTTSHFEGIVLASKAVTVNTGASVNGRLLAQTNVTLLANTIVQPAP